MNTEPIILMITVQSMVTITMIYCFWKVLRGSKGPKP